MAVNVESVNMKEYLAELEKGIQVMKNYNSRDVILFHHNDSDGLTSGAILLKSLDRAGYNIRRYPLEKPYPAVLEKIFSREEGKIIFFADFAGRIAPLISKLNAGKNLVVILDHHKAVKVEDPYVLNLNPDFFGLKGDRDISASVVCYNFAVLLDRANTDLVHIAAFGGIADFYYLDNKVHSYNLECLDSACSAGLMRKDFEKGRERFYIKLGEREVDVLDFYPLLDIAGGAGFYSSGPETGIKLLLEGITDSALTEIDKLKQIKEKIFAREFERLKKGELKQGEFIQWFDVKDRFKPMGVKMIGVFCEELSESGIIDPDKYIAGFQKIPDEIPGLGAVEMGQTKISMRSSTSLSQKIISRAMPGMDSFLPEAALNLGGFADACHTVAAAVTIDDSMEEKLILEAEKILKTLIKHK